ncbi:hypothetical protein AX17_003720 [Amanita inopinata Kibby_2008]|nr:hypothetical protein AX17_003720 [Amanita inopinata Kibby_2008]
MHEHAQMQTRATLSSKFVERYGEQAHRTLAAEGLAPELLYYGSPSTQGGSPSYRYLSMVVMEGETLQVAKGKVKLEKVETQIVRAVDLLHARNFVFGDLRPTNIMITKMNEVKLIDFDWAGVDGQAQYPPMISCKIDWPTDVGPLSVMYKSHDNVMLGWLKDLKKRM